MGGGTIIPNASYEVISPYSQYSNGGISSCSVCGIEAITQLLLKRKADEELLKYILDIGCSYKGNKHLEIIELLSNIRYKDILDYKKEITISNCAFTKKKIKNDLEEFIKEYKYCGFIVIKPPEVISLYCSYINEEYSIILFDSHSRGKLLPGAYFVYFDNLDYVLDYIEILFPKFDLLIEDKNMGCEFQFEMLNTANILCITRKSDNIENIILPYIDYT